MRRYFSHYHPAHPILKVPTSVDGVYDASVLLFWTIILTAARHDRSDYSLLEGLIPAVKNLLWSTAMNPPHPLPSLQAMSILCVWPLPSSSMSLDATFILAGILRTAAMHVGLYRPDILTQFSRVQYSLTSENLREAIKVWCCIYIAVDRYVFIISWIFQSSSC